MSEQVKLSPSSLAGALECPRCLVVARRDGIESDNFMPWLGNFATWEEKHFVGLNIADEVPGAPSWTVESKGTKTIRSAPLPLAGLQNQYVLAGRYDLLAKDDAGNTYIIDCKTTSMSEDKADRYRMQLSAYARIFEDPHSEDGREPIKIAGIGLLIHHPQGFMRAHESERENFQHQIHMKSHYLPVDRDDVALLEQAHAIASVLESDGYPELSPDCADCQREAFGSRLGRVSP
jgi:hypothetical protein